MMTEVDIQLSALMSASCFTCVPPHGHSVPPTLTVRKTALVNKDPSKMLAFEPFPSPLSSIRVCTASLLAMSRATVC